MCHVLKCKGKRSWNEEILNKRLEHRTEDKRRIEENGENYVRVLVNTGCPFNCVPERGSHNALEACIRHVIYRISRLFNAMQNADTLGKKGILNSLRIQAYYPIKFPSVTLAVQRHDKMDIA
jgi:sulfatase maturation enzyme AslB (radical SAM superfamily)